MRRLLFINLLLCASILAGCSGINPVLRRKPEIKTLETTGYCSCGDCCDWERTWYGRAVFTSGPNKGKTKKVGITASGTKARKGTIAADTRVFPFGTIMYIEDYGYGVVEDRGGAIKGHKIDLFFPRHSQALKWGRQKKQVKIWLPDK